MTRVSIQSPGYPSLITPTRVEVDGINVANSVRAITIDMGVDRVDRVDRVELDLIVVEGLAADYQDARVTIPERTKDVLIQLGWTPPKENS